MNYSKIYHSLIERARTRKLDSYVESHHIIPKCLGGSNDDTNLVNLTPEEHYLAHQLLVKIHPDNIKLIYAANMMTVSRNGSRKNKEYGWIKRKYSAALSESMKNNTRCVGRVLSDDTKSKISNTLKNRKKSETTISKLKRTVKCPHCSVVGGISIMKRHHFDNCKHHH